MCLQELLKILLTVRSCAERKYLTAGGGMSAAEAQTQGIAVPDRRSVSLSSKKSRKYRRRRIAMTDPLQHNCARVTGPRLVLGRLPEFAG